MPILTWQLWLAREIIEDNPLPWQKPQSTEKLTPGRVAQSFSGVLATIGTPTKSPKPRGKSPGWIPGHQCFYFYKGNPSCFNLCHFANNLSIIRVPFIKIDSFLGKKRNKKPRYPIVKKTVTRQKKEKKEKKEAA
ncbi:MAG: hypothetical protein QNJ54_19610 [Prochloraceae cyanobacterium]|nr:hypothetical protein [Prochloraceae cyanobacterium]